MSDEPLLSLVVPVVDGEAYIAANMVTILRALERLGRPFEVIAVCDGSSDATERLLREIDDPRLTVLHYERNEGKGFAICHGLAQARGRLVGFLDSDLDVDPAVVVDAALAFAADDVDAVIGSKRHPDSVVEYPLLRRIYSAGYHVLVRTLFRVRARDTQVGAKVFRRELIETVRPLLLVKRYAFDLELLAVAAEFGFDRVREVPIRLNYRFSGTGINWNAVYRMLLDTLAIAYRIHVRHWYVRRFAAVQRQRMDAMAGEVAERAAA